MFEDGGQATDTNYMHDHRWAEMVAGSLLVVQTFVWEWGWPFAWATIACNNI